MPRKYDRCERVLVKCLGVGSLKREHYFWAVQGGGNRQCPVCLKKLEAMVSHDRHEYHDYREQG